MPLQIFKKGFRALKVVPSVITRLRHIVSKKSRHFRVLELNAMYGARVLASLPERHPGKTIEYHGTEKLDMDDMPRFERLNAAFGMMEDPHSKPPVAPNENVSVKWHQPMQSEKFLRNRKVAPDNYFDEIHYHMEHNLPRFHEHLENLYRILRPGGVVYIIEQSNPYYIKEGDIFAGGKFYSGRNKLLRELPRNEVDRRIEKTRKGREYRYGVSHELSPAKKSKRVERARALNKKLINRIKKAGFEVLRVSVGKINEGKMLEIPPGVERPGKKMPRYAPTVFLSQVSRFGHKAAQIVVLLKPNKEKDAAIPRTKVA